MDVGRSDLIELGAGPRSATCRHQQLELHGRCDRPSGCLLVVRNLVVRNAAASPWLPRHPQVACRTPSAAAHSLAWLTATACHITTAARMPVSDTRRVAIGTIVRLGFHRDRRPQGSKGGTVPSFDASLETRCSHLSVVPIPRLKPVFHRLSANRYLSHGRSVAFLVCLAHLSHSHRGHLSHREHH